MNDATAMDADEVVLATAVELAAGLNLKPATIRAWASDGLIRRHGQRGRAALYRVDETFLTEAAIALGTVPPRRQRRAS